MAERAHDIRESMKSFKPFLPYPGVEIHKQRKLCRVKMQYGKYGGYKKDILTENLSDRDIAFLICGICEGIMRNACVSGSGEQICSCCEVQESMPKPRGLPRIHPRHTPNLAVRKMVNSLMCSCALLKRGCEWLGTLQGCEDHLDTCGYVRDQCKLKCRVVLQRNELRVHEMENCPKREVLCEHCTQKFISRELSTHLKMCLKIKVSCELCGEVMYREDMVQHIEHDCVEKEVECPFASYMKN